MTLRRRLAVVLLSSMVLLAGAGSAHALEIGYFDPLFVNEPATRDVWLQRASDDGSGVVRLAIRWSSLAPVPPANATDPADPAYTWTKADAAVRAAAAHGQRIMLTVDYAPAWAEGSGRPSDIAVGAWRPNAAAFGQFARALARRYSGRYPDPLAVGATLPRVAVFQAWNEPNLELYLAPQWVKRSGKQTRASPSIYRDLLNAFYLGVKAVDPSALVAEAGTAPYGDPGTGGKRIPPAAFVRDLVSKTVRFDILDHHPYGIRGPTSHALNPDDVAIPDMDKLIDPVKQAIKAGRVLPRKPKQYWATEISWDSRPPDPQGVPAQTQARWLQESLYVLSREGVSTIMWFQIRDSLPIPSYAATYQSGTYLYDGTPKPSATAFRFPFVIHGRSLWGRSPAAGTVVIRRAGGGGGVVARIKVARHGIFQRRVKVARGTKLQATIGGDASLVSSVG